MTARASCSVIFALVLCCPAFARTRDKTRQKVVPPAPAPDSPREYKFVKKIDPGALQSELIAAGFSVNWIDCSVDNCTIHMKAGEKKDPMPLVDKYVYIDPRLEAQKKVDSMRALYAKWRDGTISPEEKDDLLKRLAAHVLGL